MKIYYNGKYITTNNKVYNKIEDIPNYKNDVNTIEIIPGTTEIKDCAFYGCTSLTDVIIPNSINRIGHESFSNCISLNSIFLPDSITVIEISAFSSSGIEKIKLPNKITRINASTFWDCQNLKEVKMPDSVEIIDEMAFWNCKNLGKINISKNLKSINTSAFCHCKNITQVNLPNTLMTIKKKAFFDCIKLNKINLPDNIKIIEEKTFEKCISLQVANLPKNLEEIKKEAFCNCKMLTEIKIPYKIDCINESTFSGCVLLKNVNFLGNINRINNNAFYNCNALEEINLSNNINYFGNDAFCGCFNLKEIKYKNINIKKIFFIKLDGINVMDIANNMIENKIPINYFNIIQTERKIHLNEEDTLENYCKYGFNMCNIKYNFSKETSDKLKTEFINSNKFHHRYPKLIDEFAIFCDAYNISTKDFVNTFDIKYTKEIIDKKIPLYPALLLKTKYSMDICINIIKNEQLEFIAFLIGKYNITKNEKYKDFNDFFVKHLNLNIDSTLVSLSYFNELTINKNTTLKDLNEQFFNLQHKNERENIENKYGINLSDCKCNIEPIKIEYDNKIARVLNFKKEEDLNLAIELGYYTYCCQHFNAAGESAMMHGLLNPDAGFWVIEDNSGAILAQAMIWIDTKGSLIFDSIEFSNTNLENTNIRIEQLSNIIAKWAQKSSFENIIMGSGRNEKILDKMENSYTPIMTIPDKENELLNKDNFYIKMYSDTEHCVYIKKDKIISNYLMENYNAVKGNELKNNCIKEDLEL